MNGTVIVSLSLKMILGGKNCISCILFALFPMMRSPHHIPARNVTAVMNMMATTNTSATAPSQLGNDLIKAINVSSMFIFPYAPTGTTVTMIAGALGLTYGLDIAAIVSGLQSGSVVAYTNS